MKENIHIRLEEDLVKAVRDFAARHGISLAAAVSVLLRQSLEGES